jgi:NADP-dependent 3-hydroxy acid dehydrogenase YdfG
MKITTKDWTAQIDRMPGAASFRTLGTVTVANSGVIPTLVRSEKQDKSFDLRLDLVLQNAGGASLQVLTDKVVEYKELGDSNVTGVSIFFEGQLVHHIDNVIITH